MKQYKLNINGKTFLVTVESVDENGNAVLTVNGKERRVNIEGASVEKTEKSVSSPVRTAVTPAEVKAVPQVSHQSSSSGNAVTTPLPGVIIGIAVNVGDKVTAGQTVATLEAMKMENAIETEVAGTVTAVHVQRGDSVLEGAKIVTIE